MIQNDCGRPDEGRKEEMLSVRTPSIRGASSTPDEASWVFGVTFSRPKRFWGKVKKWSRYSEEIDMKMKLAAIAITLAALVGGTAGCATRAQEGALIGGALGAGTGAIIGNQSGHTGEGALIGGAAGALGGAVIGNQTDQHRGPR
jgi:hypothetical protein